MNLQNFLFAAGQYLRSSPIQVEKIIKSAPFRYKHYTIPKRTGGRRDIYHPSPALKSVQRWMVGVPLVGLPVHDSVYSYVEGRNIGMNAAAHLRSNYFIRFDFMDFFPSITDIVLRSFLRQAAENNAIDLDEAAIDAVVRLACRATDVPGRLALSIGAPSSPFLSNAILYEFDSLVSRQAAARGVIYTRYADDIYMSSTGMAVLDDFEKEFRSLTKRFLPFLNINEDKVQRLSRKRRVTITGVNVASDRTISVGRNLKRSIRTRLYLALSGQLEVAEFSSLRGSIAYVMSIEPDYLMHLRRKFGEESINNFMASSV